MKNKKQEWFKEEITNKSGLNFPVLVLLLFAVVVIYFTFTVTIQPGYQGIWIEFGKVKEVVPSGLYFRIPVKDNVVPLSNQIIKYEITNDISASSKDLQVVNYHIVVNYRRDSESMEYLWVNFMGDEENRIVYPILQEISKSITAKYTAEELITKRSEVSEKIKQNLQVKLKEYHLTLLEVNIVNFDFSDNFNEAIENKVVAEQNYLREITILEQKKILAQQKIVEANATAESAILIANGHAQAVLISANAQSQAMSMMNEKLNEKYLTYLYVSSWDGHLPQVMGNNGILVNLNGELDETK
jgi:regulator of protease activity HflC (stomatin/prohibitin superfamily)